MGAKQSVLSQYKPFFAEFLDRRGEVGGFFDTRTKELKVTKKAKGLHLDSMPEYPERTGVIGWHVHPQSSEDQARKDGAKYPLIATPTQVDIETSLRSSLHYKEPTVNIIVSKAGLFMYKPSKSFLKLLLEYPEEKREKILKTIVLPNVIHIQTVVSDTPHNQIKLYRKEMSSLAIKNDGGFETHFTPW